MRKRGTVDSCTLHFSSSIPLIVSVLCSEQNICKFSETTRSTEAKFHVVPPWDRGKDGSFFHMNKVICCYSLLSTPGMGVFSRDITTNFALQYGTEN